MLTNLFKNWGTDESQPSVMKKISGFRKIEGWLTDDEAFGLYTVAHKLPPGANVVEIGSWKGKSTYCIAQGLKKGTIHCIDPFNAAGEEGSKEIYERQKGEISLIDQFRSNLSSVKSSVKVTALQGYSNAFVGKISEIDFLFIDGDHSIEGCKFDFVNFSPDLKKGGYVAFHDYYADRSDLGPTWVIDNIVSKDPGFRLFKGFDSLQVFQKV